LTIRHHHHPNAAKKQPKKRPANGGKGPGGKRPKGDANLAQLTAQLQTAAASGPVTTSANPVAAPTPAPIASTSGQVQEQLDPATVRKLLAAVRDLPDPASKKKKKGKKAKGKKSNNNNNNNGQ
jgi:hypothetical protein